MQAAAEAAVWVLISIDGKRYTTHVRFAAGAMSDKEACMRARFHAWISIAAELLIPYSGVTVVDFYRRSNA